MIEYRMFNPVGLGSIISAVSVLLHTKQSVQITAPDPVNRTLRELKKIFKVSDEELTVVDGADIPFDGSTKLIEGSNFFSPQLSSETIEVLGQQLSVGKCNRPCIGVVAGHNTVTDYLDGFPNDKFPFNRYYSREYWAQVTNLIMAAGYDVITLNSIGITLEEKVFLINEFCDAIVGYEGGICHLAHCLKTPAIVLPWHHDVNGAPADQMLKYIIHKYHVDQKTWILEGPDELLSWGPVEFRKKICDLHNNKGNNIYSSGRLRFNPETWEIRDPENPELCLNMWLESNEKSFIKTYINPQTLK